MVYPKKSFKCLLGLNFLKEILRGQDIDLTPLIKIRIKQQPYNHCKLIRDQKCFTANANLKNARTPKVYPMGGTKSKVAAIHFPLPSRLPSPIPGGPQKCTIIENMPRGATTKSKVAAIHFPLPPSPPPAQVPVP